MPLFGIADVSSKAVGDCAIETHGRCLGAKDASLFHNRAHNSAPGQGNWDAMLVANQNMELGRHICV